MSMNSIQLEPYPLKLRDISWLKFNERVLQEAADKRVPLYERVKFLAIFSSNLDEFFRVRVSAMREFKKLKKTDRKEYDIKPRRTLKLIYDEVQKHQTKFGQIFREQIIPELKENNIQLLKEEEYTEEQFKFIWKIYSSQIKPLLTSVPLSEQKKAPFLQNQHLYFLLVSPDSELSMLNIPSEKLGRFFLIPEQDGMHPVVFIDDIIRICLQKDEDFGKNLTAYAVKLSRDAELYIEDEFSGDLIEKIKTHVEERDTGLPTRLLYDKTIPKAVRRELKERLGLKKADMIRGGRYHNFHDFFSFPDPTGNAKLHYPKLPALNHKRLENADSILDEIEKKDCLLSFPYQKFDYIPALIEEASKNEEVTHIKITLYRISKTSEIAQNLMTALDRGKTVTVFIEAKARFDENNNIEWGEKLEKAGANVIYSYPGIKVHSKIMLIQKNNGEKNYAYIGTGNFNEKTARIYCDHGLLTAHKKIGRELEQVFQVLERELLIPRSKHLLVSPFTTRREFERLINQEIELAKAGKKAYMILKMNSLEDEQMIKKLYEAHNAGVDIKLIIRGFCCLVADIKDFSKHIQITSIVDRYLEHTRIYIFGNGGEEKMYMASADWMTRNLDRRIEVCVPVYDKKIFKTLRDIINIQLQDNTKARVIDKEETNKYVTNSKEKIRAQMATYQYLKGSD